MSAATPLTHARVKTLVSYDPTTGWFIWISGRRAGLLAGCRHGEGYETIRVDGRAYLAHRLAWLFVNGQWPTAQLDHINGVRTDNRIANLRECSNAENCQNVRAHRDGVGLLGISWEKRRGKWQAGIGIGGKRIFLGYHETKEAAHAAYVAAKQRLHRFGCARG